MVVYSYGVQLLIICPLVFIAGFIDAVAGGGGIITLPAYLITGLPIHTAYGTNKFSSTFGTTIATVQYFKGGCIRIKPALCSVAGALLGSWLGAKLALFLSERYLQYCLVVILPIVALFLVFNRGFGSRETDEAVLTPQKYCLAFLIGLAIGAYDGFFGPGTGTFLVIAFTGLLGFSLITATGNAKIVNLASNIGALVTYLINGKVAFELAIPAALCAFAGNLLGARMAVKKGAKFIRPVILVAVGMLFLKIIFDLI